jgi:hypothetical protein
MSYQIGDKVKIKRHGPEKLEIEIGGQKAIVYTEDLAALVKEELPKDRSRYLFSEIQSEVVKKGKARVVVKARKPIAKDEEVCFTIDITKHLDSQGKPRGIRTTPGGLIF